MYLSDHRHLNPQDVKPGQVFACIVTCHIQYDGSVRLYRCPFSAYESVNGIPQGDRIFDYYDDTVIKALFPVVKWAIDLSNEKDKVSTTKI